MARPALAGCNVPAMKKPVIAALALFFAAAFLAAPSGRAEPRGAAPVVVELFTSQGCSSCPPADAYLRELARDPGILALSMHVDYWNGLGWKDPFSNREVTLRQRDYVRRLGGHYTYTPQMVVMGRAQATGSNRADVARLIARARAEAPPPPSIEIGHPSRDKLTIRIGARPFVGRATVWLLAYDSRHETKIPTGENRGKTLAYANVVRSIRSVGQWAGAAAEFTVDVAKEVNDGYENCAVIVQADGVGPIIGVSSMPMRVAAR